MSSFYYLSKSLKPLQVNKEIDSMLRNSTRDLKRLQDFCNREKNELYRRELQEILIHSWAVAEMFDGCNRKTLESMAFKERVRRVSF